jgi:hypothetical protein
MILKLLLSLLFSLFEFCISAGADAPLGRSKPPRKHDWIGRNPDNRPHRELLFL